MSSFSIPKNTEDPLASTSATTEYPLDHLVNFRGNSDDNFRIGIKITRKAWRVVMMPANEDKLMECDIIIASPLGIKMQSEREESTDLLSSIEVAVVDGIDVMQMQNWDHVQVSSVVHAYSQILISVHILPPQQNAQITSRM
jgi:U3 small nucleolar RNA-associated protein 25